MVNMKLDKLTILKQLFKKIPIPKIPEPKLEDLQYPESRVLFKLKKNLNYCYAVHDTVSYNITKHDSPAELVDYHKIFDAAMNFMIHLVEKDSFYRYRVKMALFMMSSDVFLTHFYKNIVELGFDDITKWNGKTVMQVKAHDGKPRRDGTENPGIFDHLIPKKAFKKLKEEKL